MRTFAWPTLCATLIAFCSLFVGLSTPVIAQDSPAPTDKQSAIWNVLLLVYPNIDADYTDTDGTSRHLIYTMSAAEVEDGVHAFRQYPAIAHDLSDQETFVTYRIVYVDRPITSLSPLGNDSYWPSPDDVRTELDRYAPPGSLYDSVFVLWPQANLTTGQQIPCYGWGLALGASSWSNGATYAVVSNAETWTWQVPTVGEVWLHEWLHGVARYYIDQGYRLPEKDADGGGWHGYTASPETGWSSYYRDLMTEQVMEDGVPTGIPAAAWRDGSIVGAVRRVFADYFTADTLGHYTVTGSAEWYNNPAHEQYVLLGSAVSADNRMYIPFTADNSFTITARVLIPSSGIDVWDSGAVALSNGGSEYWAMLFYGTNLVERNSIGISRNDQGGSLTPLTLQLGTWYTIRFQAKRETLTLSMKAWADGENEPADWQTTLPLSEGWDPTHIGFRHYGPGRAYDDLVVVEEPTRYSTYLPAIVRR